jgi:hypothetical protein
LENGFAAFDGGSGGGGSSRLFFLLLIFLRPRDASGGEKHEAKSQ